MGTYIPSTTSERAEMLQKIGIENVDALFSSIPKGVQLRSPLDIPIGQSEMQVRKYMEGLAHSNVVFESIFRGAGAYNHYIPSVVKHIVGKEEFVTAYTPYQAELSQGVLQGIFEYQTMICELTGMNASNASVYDGQTAAAEAVLMCKDRGKNKVLVSSSVHPQTIAVVSTYCEAQGLEVLQIPTSQGQTDLEELKGMLGQESACVLIQQPNYFGLFEDAKMISEMTHNGGAKLVMSCNPIALSVMQTPAEVGADIAVGEGQPLGNPLGFGGPYLGFMACTTEMLRRLPGRIVGETVDLDGKRAFVLTLQAREQHIRREKSSSNICSNQALCALTASVYMSVMGPEGVKEVATQCYSKAHYAMKEITAITGFERVHTGDFFHEFVTKSPVKVLGLMLALEEKGILGGFPLKGQSGCEILWCVTEQNSKEDIDFLVKTLLELIEDEDEVDLLAKTMEESNFETNDPVLTQSRLKQIQEECLEVKDR